MPDPTPHLEGIYVHKINPKNLSSARIRGIVLAAMQKEGHYVKGNFDNTIATWEDAPTFKVNIKYAGGNLELTVQPHGTDHQVWKWIWLDKGTRIRYATMSRDWRSKTRVGSFSSGSGAGYVRYVSKKNPRPGIAARGWSALMARRMKTRFAKHIDEAVRKAIFG